MCGPKATYVGAKATYGGPKATYGGAKATYGVEKATYGGAKATYGGPKATYGGAKAAYTISCIMFAFASVRGRTMFRRKTGMVSSTLRKKVVRNARTSCDRRSFSLAAPPLSSSKVAG